MILADLSSLLEVLRGAGVTVYQTPELALHLGPASAPVEPEESIGDMNRRLREQDKRAALDELAVAFAHVPGGAPPEAIAKVVQEFEDSSEESSN